MPIAVTCPKCLTRFSVNEKFAGKKGPCPKCKGEITIPSLEEQVVVHAPPDVAPKDSKGQSVLKPIKRQEAKFSAKLIGGSVAGVVAMLALAVVCRFLYVEGPPIWLRVLVGLAIAPPLVRLGYAISHDSELEPFRGNELWGRVGIVSVVLAATWLIYVVLAPYVLDLDFAAEMDMLSAGIALVVMLVFGSITAMLAFEIEGLGGLVIAGIYVAAALLLAVISGTPLVGY